MTERETLTFDEILEGTDAERLIGMDIVEFEWVEGGLRVYAENPPGAVHVSHGHVKWDENVPDEFLDLFIETVEQSEFMATEWVPGDTMDGHDLLVIKEVKKPGE